MHGLKASHEFEKIPVASLRVGLQLPFDIHDADAVLLLAKGSVITASFHRKMQARRAPLVLISKAETAALSPAPVESEPGGNVDFQTEQSRSLDAVKFHDPIANGRALVERFEKRRTGAYDSTLVRQILASRDRDAVELNKKLSQLVEGSEEISGADIEECASEYIKHIANDLDATVCGLQAPRKGNSQVHHALQMSILGMALAAQLGLSEEDVRITGMTALIHDVGMMRLPSSLLNAPRRLHRSEFLEVMKHPILTVEMTERVLGIPNRCRMIAYQVHERVNGSGYPRQRSGPQIYFVAKILGIVDAYLAMICDRPYRPAVLPYKAMERILKEATRGVWDPRVTRGLLTLIGLFPIGSFVSLSNGILAKVMRSGGKNFAAPQVRVTHDSDGIPQKNGALIDLASADAGSLKIDRAIPPLFGVDDDEA